MLPLLWVCLARAPWHHSPWPEMEVERCKHQGEKKIKQNRKRTALAVFPTHQARSGNPMRKPALTEPQAKRFGQLVPGFACTTTIKDHDGFGGAQLWLCWPLAFAGVLSIHKQASGSAHRHAAPQASPDQGWCGCRGRQPCIPPQSSMTPALIQLQPPAWSSHPGTRESEGHPSLAFQAQHCSRQYLRFLPLHFQCVWPRAPRSQPGKQFSAQAAFSLPKLFLLGAEVGNAIAHSTWSVLCPPELGQETLLWPFSS